MGKRLHGVGNNKTTRSPKTKKRLAIKAARLAELAEKRARYSKKKK